MADLSSFLLPYVAARRYKARRCIQQRALFYLLFYFKCL